MSITLEKVLEFVQQASSSQLHEIADALMDVGFSFTCDECDMHECDECDCDDDFTYQKREFLQGLAYRADTFGFDEMLSELKIECTQLGVNLKVQRGVV